MVHNLLLVLLFAGRGALVGALSLRALLRRGPVRITLGALLSYVAINSAIVGFIRPQPGSGQGPVRIIVYAGALAWSSAGALLYSWRYGNGLLTTEHALKGGIVGWMAGTILTILAVLGAYLCGLA